MALCLLLTGCKGTAQPHPAPRETAMTLETVPPTSVAEAAAPRYVPVSLLDELIPLVESGEGWHEYLKGLAIGTEAPLELFQEYVWSEDWEGVLASVTGLLADVDNDGMADAVFTDDKGSGHFTTLHVLRNKGDGTYELIVQKDFNRADVYWCISWEGRQYLVSGAYDRDGSRRFIGLNIYALGEGAVQERVFLTRDRAEYTVTEQTAQSGYEAMVNRLVKEGADIWTAYDREKVIQIGTAERTATEAEWTAFMVEFPWFKWYDAADVYACDWGDDKAVYTKQWGFVGATGRALESTLYERLPTGIAPCQLFWFDACGEETLLVTVTNFADDPVQFGVYRWISSAWKQVASMTLEAHWAVSQLVWTQGIEIDFSSSDWAWAWNCS